MPTSQREQVLAAVKTLLEEALTAADVRRNGAKSGRIGPGGLVIMRDGDPGDPIGEILSPRQKIYAHRIPLELAADPSGGAPEAALDQLISAARAAVEADKTLGGLVDALDWEEPMVDDLDAEGAEETLWAAATIVAEYAA